MKRYWYLAAFLVVLAPCGVAVGQSSPLAPIPGTGPLKSSDSSAFTFIVAGDNRPAKAKLPQPPTPRRIFAAANKRKAAFLIWTGDIIYGLDTADAKAIGQQYDAFFSLARQAGAPVFVAPGNHEMDVKVSAESSSVKEVGSAPMQALYRTNMGLAANAPIYGAFSYGNSRFILLNSEEIPPPTEKRSPHAKTASKVNLDPGYIGQAQLDWLKQELDSNKAAHTFVFMHHPIKPKKSTMGLNKKNAKALMELFSRHSNISYVLASHEHLYYNVQTGDASAPPSRKDPSKKPPYYLISGGAGAPLTGKPAHGGFHNYLVFQVQGDRVSASLVKLP
jgi:3',5'-cyclic AMP phosphodiesterase CpdA